MAKRVRSLMKKSTKPLTRREMKRLERKRVEKEMKENDLTSPFHVRKALKLPAKKRDRRPVVLTSEVTALLEEKGKKTCTAHLRRKLTERLRARKILAKKP